MIKIKIQEKQVNVRNKAGHVPCPHNKIFPLKLTPIISCQLNCSRYAGVKDGFLLCGEPGTNQVTDTKYSQLELVLRSYGENREGGI
jgi:hypothetical protein